VIFSIEGRLRFDHAREICRIFCGLRHVSRPFFPLPRFRTHPFEVSSVQSIFCEFPRGSHRPVLPCFAQHLSEKQRDLSA
jgi:hypothetical protein